MRLIGRAIPVLAAGLGRQATCFLIPSPHQITARGTGTWGGTGHAPLAGKTRHSIRRARSASSRLSMGIFEDISSQMKACLKSGEKEKLSGLRMIRAAFLTETKTTGSGNTLPDDMCIPILRKMSKMQQESIDMYRQGDRQDLVEKESHVLELIDSFLPQLADEATTQKWVDDAIATTGATGPSDMGKVMGILMKNHKAEMDGKLAQKLVTARLKGE
ncbi:unnamed protein product [Ascophyllum nodosum]